MKVEEIISELEKLDPHEEIEVLVNGEIVGTVVNVVEDKEDGSYIEVQS